MKETTQPPKDPKKKLWIGYAIILAIVILSNVFLFPALMQASVKSVNYSTFLQMLESKELATVQIEDQQIYFVDKNDNSYKTNAIAQDNNLVTRLEDAGVEFGTVYQSPTIWDSLLNLLISFLPMIILFWFVNRWASKKMQEMGGAGGNAMLFGGKSGAKQYVVDDETGIKFNDVAGEDEAKESLQEIVDFLNNPKKYEEIGAKMPKGVLLVGPPGTGKTLLARAVAGEAGVPFFSIAGSEFVDVLKDLGWDKVREIQQGFLRQLADDDKMQKQSLSLSIILTADKLATDYLFKDRQYISLEEAREVLVDRDELSDNERCYQYVLDKVAMNPARFDDKVENVEKWGTIENGYAIIYTTAFTALCKEGGFSRASFLSWANRKGLLQAEAGGKKMDKLKSFKGNKVRCVFLKLNDNTDKDGFIKVDEDGVQETLPFN